ncbi:MAG: hypothetical protein KME46_22220 [Brasilonema angustatum HA4187-MV1]|jgi:hypothetical protein|nr:hypothetical protein [Brasilonema angustatum HA4187-MV1]
MTARKQRKPLSETLGNENDISPEMEAFRKGVSPAPPVHEEVVEENKSPKQKTRKLVIELEPELYDAFAAACFHKKLKMAKVVRAWISEFTNE